VSNYFHDSTELLYLDANGNWGRKTWHQTLRRQVETSAEFLSVYIFCIRNGTLVSRYVKLMLAFAFSGLLHHFASGLAPWREGRAMSCFLLQGLGIMAEDGVQEIYRCCGGKPRWWSITIGYIWTAVFQAYTTSRWVSQISKFTRPGIDNLVPFSVLTFLGLS
jgi:hypothetical protein